MPRSGPAPTPTTLKIIRGNPGHRPTNKGEPTPMTGEFPTPPVWLDRHAKDTWMRVGPELHRLGLLTGVDHAAFVTFCEAVGEFKLATEALKREGHVLTTKSGYRQPNPWVSIRNSAAQRIGKFAVEFGLTPSARCHLTIANHEDKPGELENLLFG